MQGTCSARDDGAMIKDLGSLLDRFFDLLDAVGVMWHAARQGGQGVVLWVVLAIGLWRRGMPGMADPIVVLILGRPLCNSHGFRHRAPLQLGQPHMSRREGQYPADRPTLTITACTRLRQAVGRRLRCREE
eukprot:8011772-Alexandrium_andersonii.AAC.1